MSLDRQVDQVVVRPFSPDEWGVYKAVRLQSLQVNPEAYGSSYAKEAAWPDQKWRESLSDRDLAVFGVFYESNAVGMIGVHRKRDDAPDLAGIWGVWLKDDWRGRKLTKPMYEACLAWARQHPAVRRVYVGHREGNEASRRMTLSNGFSFVESEDYDWPDGRGGQLYIYELQLRGK